MSAKAKKQNLFKIGNSGRPKGTKNKTTECIRNFKSLAAEKYQEAFDLLWSNMQNGEGWAYQIYFKDIIPKKVHQPTIVIRAKEGETRAEAIINALPQFEELTHNEALDEIKVLKGIEEKEEQKDRGIMLLNLLPVEQLKQIDEWVENAKKENEKILANNN